ERNRRGAAVRQYHRLERKRGGPPLHPTRPPAPRRTKALLLSDRRRREREWIRGGHHPHVFAAKRRVSANRQRVRQRAAETLLVGQPEDELSRSTHECSSHGRYPSRRLPIRPGPRCGRRGRERN